MKKSIFILCLGILFLQAQAQEKPLAKIHYEFKHVNDTTQLDKFIRDEVVTYLGKEGSYYTSYSSTRMQEQISKQMSSATFDGNLVISKNSTPTADSYFLDVAKQRIQLVTKVGREEYKLNDDFPTQEWEIGEETKEIGGYSCQKATTTFKGRNYIAWFATDIPMSYGPWKLHGLPGLILSAHDDKNEVKFDYAGFDKMDDPGSIIVGVSDKAKDISKPELEKLQKAFKENPSAFLQAQSSSRSEGTTVTATGRFSGSSTSGGGSTFRIQGGSASSSGAMDPSKIKSMTVKSDDDYKPSKITNNPIELTK